MNQEKIVVKADRSLKVVSRLAPSPTASFLHIGNIRTMLYNYFIAKKNGGKFLIRLEDTDRGRYTPEFIPYFKEVLKWLDINPDESPWNPNPEVGSYVQSERDYTGKVKFLLDKGLAYYAFDTQADLEAARKENPNFKYDHSTRMKMKNSFTIPKETVDEMLENGTPYVVRFAVKPDVEITFEDLIRDNVTINSSQLDDKVLIKSDGIASYHLANTCDDHDMGVTYVVRGEEWIVSTPFHILLYKSFGWDCPNFAHLPLIMNPDGKGKLSKRNAEKYGIPIAPFTFMTGDNFDKESLGWKESGYSSEVFINFLSLMGWHPEGDKEILSMDELIDQFSLDRVVKHGARFNMDKAKWMNSEYIKMKDNSEIIDYISNVFDTSKYSYTKLDAIAHICKQRAVFMTDILPVAKIFFTDMSVKVDDVMFKNTFTHFLKRVHSIKVWKAALIKDEILAICDEMGIKIGKLMPGLRNSLTGGVSGPDLMTTMEIIGREETYKRIKESI